MTQLETIYLMNVALYLPLKDIPTFIQINSKTKDAIDGLRINPIDSGETFKRDKEMKIISTCFPRLETIQLTPQTLYRIFDCPEEYIEYFTDNIQFIRTNDIPSPSYQDQLELNQHSSTLKTDIDPNDKQEFICNIFFVHSFAVLF